MKIKNIILLGLVLILLSSFVLAEGENGTLFYNWEGGVGDLTDRWGSNTGEVTGMTYTSTVPIFAVSGDGGLWAGNFDGTNDVMETTDDVIFNTGESFTITMERNASDVTIDRFTFGTSKTSGAFGSGYLYINDKWSIADACNGRSVLRFEDDTSGVVVAFCQTDVDVYDGDYHDEAIIYNDTSDTCSWWVDGVNRTLSFSSGSCTLAVSNINAGGNNGNFSIGRRDSNDANFAKLNMDNFRIFLDRVLTPNEISNLHDFGVLTGVSTTSDLTLKDDYNSSSIPDFRATITNSSGNVNISTLNGSIVYPIEQIVNVSIFNISTNTYFNRTILNWNTTNDLEVSVWQSTLQLTAENDNSAQVFNFSCENAFINMNSILSTGIILMNISSGNQSFDCSSYGYINITQSYIIQSLKNTNEIITFKNSTMTLVFRDEEDHSLYNSSLVNIELFSEDLDFTQNFTTSNGSVIISSIPNSFYNLLFEATDTNKRSQFFFIPPDAETFELTLFVINETNSAKRGFIVQDENGQRLQDIQIKIEKFFGSQGGFVTVGNYITNINGIAPIEFVDYSLYRYTIFYNDEEKATDSEFLVLAILGDTKTFSITIGDETVVDIRELSFINVTLTNISSTFVMTWDDPSNNVIGACLDANDEVRKIRIGRNCTSGASGTLTFTITNTSGEYSGIAFVNTSSRLLYKQTLYMNLNAKINDMNSRTNFIWIIFIIMIVLFMVLINLDWRIALIVSIPLMALIFQKIGLLAISLNSVIFLFLAVITISLISKSTGRT